MTYDFPCPQCAVVGHPIFEIFVAFFTSHGVQVEWCENVLPKSYEAEMVEDMISLMSSFSARVYGRRSAENAKKKREAKADAQSV